MCGVRKEGDLGNGVSVESYSNVCCMGEVSGKERCTAVFLDADGKGDVCAGRGDVR